jgi:serine/threonine protein kinase
MPARVTLTVVEGKLRGQTFAFEERTTCLIGRAADCDPRVPNDEDHRSISRHHCLLDINPPDVRVRDFGSLNGTYVNDRKIGQRPAGVSAEEAAGLAFPEHDLRDGDRIRLEGTVFQVGISCPVVCAHPGCSMELSATEAQSPDENGCCWCSRHQVQATRPRQEAAAKGRQCAHCGKEVGGEAGANRPGELICAACKADPQRLLADLLARANRGERDLAAIRDYTILRQLGRGGMGAVYLARHERTGEEVALKVMLPRVAVEPRAREMFLREAENTRILDHPNVVRLRDAGCSDGTFFFTLDYCEGGSAEGLLRERGGKLPLTEAIPLVLQALAGLTYAHEVEVPHVRLPGGAIGRGRGLVHRDLSPHNLLLTGTGATRRARVSDYGLAKAFDTAGLSGQTRTGEAMGKPAFMPRQQVVNFKYAQPEVDVWAAAATLYCLLTGVPPRDFPAGRDPWQLVLQSDPVPIRRRDSSIPPRLAEVIDAALADKGKLSFTTAASFAQALEDAVRRDGILIPPAAPPSPAVASPVLPPPAPPSEPPFTPHGTVLRYPAPLALPYRRFLQQKEPRLRLDALFYVLESTLRYLVTLGISDLFGCLAARGEPAELPAHAAFDFLRKPRPMQLGMWCEALRETARALAPQEGQVVQELPSVCRPGGRLDGEIVPWLIERRNRCAHREGGIALASEECRELLHEARPRLEEALGEVRFVCRYPLGFARRGLGPRTAASNRYALHSCMGAHVRDTTEAEVIETPISIPEEIAFVVAPDGGRLLFLWPLLAQRVSPLTGRPTLYLLESIADRRRPFLAEIRSAAIDAREDWVQLLRDETPTSHAWVLERIRSFPSPLAVPADLGLSDRLAPRAGGRLVGQDVGPYRIQAVIAVGGASTVYAAVNSAGAALAVKVLESSPVPGQATRFLREFEELKRVSQHPTIIRCLEGGIAVLGNREYPWYAMELAAAGSLRSRLDDRKTRSTGQAPWDDEGQRREVSEEFLAIADAVAHLHGLEVVHRDIRPDNVLIVADGTLRLAGFGLARGLGPAASDWAEGACTSAGVLLGSQGYMAPEQARGQEAGKPADVYALGVLLAELATGRQPEPVLRPGQASTLANWQPVQRLPAGLRRLILSCTDLLPEQRPADAGAMRQAFLSMAR